MDFKAQIIKDLKVFHNPGEFAEMMCIWYEGQQYEVSRGGKFLHD